MTSTEQPPVTRSNSKRTVAVVTTVAVLLIVLGGLLLQQWSRNRILEERLHDARNRLEQYGAIELTDPTRLHVRWLPTSRRQEELACRIHVPANRSYRLVIHAGPIPRDSGLPKENSGLQLPVDLPACDAHREITVLGGLQFNHKQGRWEIACRINDPTGIDYPANGITLFIPPDCQRYFTVAHSAREFHSHFDREKTFVFPATTDNVRLATAMMYEYPLGADGDVDFGDSTFAEWLTEQVGEPATGFMFWIEEAPVAISGKNISTEH